MVDFSYNGIKEFKLYRYSRVAEETLFYILEKNNQIKTIRCNLVDNGERVSHFKFSTFRSIKEWDRHFSYYKKVEEINDIKTIRVFYRGTFKEIFK